MLSLAGSAPAPIIRALCRACGKWRHPKEFVHDSIVGYCWHCYEWHHHALAVLAGGSPRGCQECGGTHDALQRLGGSADVRYGMHVKDGLYQMLGVACGCDASYTRKRRDLYGRTPFGARLF